MLTVDRNQITGKLPDGSVKNRSQGTFAKWGSQAPYQIGPGLSHELNIEFDVPSKDLIQVAMQLHGFVVDGKSVELPDLIAVPQ
jgi:hypothetical protein